MNKVKKRRFIAGATCPSCKRLDTIMLYIENNVEQLKCTECDYHESQADTQVQKQVRGNESVIGVFKPD